VRGKNKGYSWAGLENSVMKSPEGREDEIGTEEGK